MIERDRIELSYEQLADRAARLASALVQLDARRGARVALLAHNCAGYVELLYACWTIGACAVPINVRLHPKEVAFILDDADVHVAFVTGDIDTTAIEHERIGTTHFVDGLNLAWIFRRRPRGCSTPAERQDDRRASC